ncbi:hypothetical protein RJT34_32912 [Clitoria ternatea]|uniref:Uncharacterized protein n=1 Tax=Clitoria ternatea TaxID=43366 RepID=A0AAN9EYC5_CLITE
MGSTDVVSIISIVVVGSLITGFAQSKELLQLLHKMIKQNLLPKSDTMGFRSYNSQFKSMKGTRLKKRLKSMVGPDKSCETRGEDVAWLCSLSESEIDMLISLKLLVIQRAKMIGCKELVNIFSLKMIRAIALVLMEHLRAEIKDSSLIPDKVKSTTFLDPCNLLKCSNEADANIEELSTIIGADIQTFLIRQRKSKRKKQKVESTE